MAASISTLLPAIADLSSSTSDLILSIRVLRPAISSSRSCTSNGSSPLNVLISSILDNVVCSWYKASVEKYKSQQDNVRNNREYDFLTKEIEFQSLEMELCEKRIKEFTAEEQEKSEEIEKNTKALEERQKDLDQKKNELDEIIEETKQEEEKLRDKAKDLETKIEPRLLQSFKRIRKNSRNGLGIVYVQRDACGGCFNKIPPQRQLDIRSRKKIIVCEYCGRIMIDPELAGVEIEHKVEEAPVTTKRAIRRKAE